MSKLEQQFEGLWLSYYSGIDLYSEYKFHPKRRFRFDFACPIAKVGIEIQGGIYSKSPMGHNTGSGLEADYRKFCAASSLGWVVFPLSAGMINVEFLTLIAKTIHDRRLQFVRGAA